MFNDVVCDIQPEMMDPESTTQQQNAGAVVLNTIEQDSTVVPAPVVEDNFWINNSTSDKIVDLPHASCMEILTRQFEWSSTMNVGYEIFSIDLPGDAISRNMNHAAAMLFGQYAYWNGDMKVRIHINTTPFHVGKLIFSWYYGEEYDADNHSRKNIASAVQLPHVCYSASKGGDVVLEIPYRNYRSMICTRKKSDDSLNFYLGTLTCRVFNPLTTDISTSVSGYMHVSILNSSFTGICPRRDVQAEMMPTTGLVKKAEGVLRAIDMVANMDKPSNPAVPIMYTPQFSDSFATGTGDVSNVHSLRLDPAGQTQHPPGCTGDVSETSIFNIVRKWGFLKTIAWKTSYNREYNLYSLPVTPELPFNKYYQVPVTRADGVRIMGSVLPPVSAMCCINAYNRGSIEIKVEIINSRYHTGALDASFTPVLTNVTFAEAIQSYNVTMDVGNVESYIFKIPYINERPYNPRYNSMYTSQTRLAPTGVFNLYVLNQLRAITGVSDFVYINLYMRAGDDFEVAVPVAPLYSINLDGSNKIPHVEVWPNKCVQIGLASWRYATPLADRMVVMKYNVGDDTVMQFENMQPFTVYTRDWKSNVEMESPLSVSQYILNSAGEVVALPNDFPVELKYIAMLIVNGDGGTYTYATAFENELVAKSYVQAHYSLGDNYPNSPTIAQWRRFDPDIKQFYLVIRVGAADSYRNIKFSALTDITWKHYYSVNVAGSEMDIMSDPTVSSLSSTLSGMRMFGERFADIKDYCRRYQLYCSPEVVVDANTYGKLVRIPISYLATSCANSTNSIVRNITKEGMIPYILSSFRFGRGGIRFKIIITSSNSDAAKRDDEVIYIQHKPDVQPSGRNVATYNLVRTLDASFALQSGYAYTAFSCVVNNAITIDVPCYIPTNMLMLQSPDYTRKSEILHYFLGVLDIYLPFTQPKAKYVVAVHYALSDDFQASDFVGFPPMIPLFDTSISDIQPEMDVSVVSVTSDGVLEPVAERSSVEVIPELPIKEAVGNAMDKVKQSVSKISDAVASTSKGVISGASTIINNPSTTSAPKESFMDKFTKKRLRSLMGLQEKDENDTIGSIIKDAICKFGEEYKHIIVSMVSQLFQCISHPTITSFILALLTVLTHMGLNCYPYMTKFYKWLARIFGLTDSDNDIVAEMATGENKTEISPEEAKTSFVRSLIDMSVATFGKSKEFVNGIVMPDFTSYVFTNIRLGALTVNAVVTLFKNIIDVVPRIFSWFGKYINPKKWFRWMFVNQHSFIRKWISDVEYATDPNNLAEMRSSSQSVMHIELLIIVGRDIGLKFKEAGNKEIDYPYFQRLTTKLDNVYADIAACNLTAGSIGVEPYCICIDGPSQVGKTYAIKEIVSEALKGIGYKTNEQIFYTRPMGSSFWDGVERQPVVIYDDFMQITTPTNVELIIGEFMLLKSKATFGPNRAKLEDKGKKYNPLICCLTMNEPYAMYNDLADKHAWMNRRDLMIHATLKPEYVGQNANTLSEEVLAKFDHLQFSIRRYNSNAGSNDTREMVIMEVPINESNPNRFIRTSTFDMYQIKYIVQQKFTVAYDKMKKEFLKDLKMQNQFAPDSNATFVENIESYRKYLLHNRTLFNAREKETLDSAKKYLDKTLCDRCQQSLCICNVIAVVQSNQIGKLSVQPEMDEAAAIHRRNFRQLAFDIYGEFSYDDKVVMHNINVNHAAFKYFMEVSCIHTLIRCFIPTGICIEKSNDKFVLVNHLAGREWIINDKDCICKCQDVTSIPQMAKYYVYIAGYEGSFRKMYYNQIEKITVPKPTASYIDRLNKNKKDFYAFLDEKVCPSTWLGTIGHVMYKIFKPMAYIVGIFVTLYVFKKGYNYVSSKYDAKRRKQQYNAMQAKMIENHHVTDDCVDVGCSICSIGEMAYTERLAKPKRSTKQVTTKVAQGEMSQVNAHAIDIKLRRNYFFLRATEPNAESVYCRCLGIRDKWFIGIDHYFDKLSSMPLTTRLEFVTANVSVELYLSSIRLVKLKDSALVLGLLPLQIPSFADIVDRFASKRLIENISRDALLYVVETPQKIQNVNSYVVTKYTNEIKMFDDTLFIPHIVDPANKPTTVSHYYQYQTSGQGLCGSVLITEMNVTTPLIGIHIAGAKQGGCGYSEVVCSETLIDVIENYDDQRITDVEVEGQMFNGTYIQFSQNVYSCKATLNGNYDFIGTVSKKYAHNPPTKSKCIHSMCYNQITESTYDYPHLSHRDERFEGSPMLNGCQHHVIPVKPFDNKELLIVCDDVQNYVLAKVKPARMNVGTLTITQSVVGIHDIVNYDAMEMDTSEGFPFTSMRPKGISNKKWLFDLDLVPSGYVLKSIHPVLDDVLKRKQEQRENGIVPMTVFTDCLKDIKLPKEKCYKTRIFSISPVDFTIQFRQYFYDFTIAFQNARFDIESAIGINTDSYEWNNMVQLLLSNSTNFVCGDYSKFGPRLMTSCVLKFFQIIIEWYKYNGDMSPVNERVRWIMAHEIAFANHLMLNKIYRVYSGAPSGSPITTILNNGVNMMYIRMAYYHLVCKLSQFSNIDDVFNCNSVSKMHEYIRVIFYGDDLIMTVKDKITDLFNAETISLFFSKYDIKFTDALKTGSVSKVLNVFCEETSFLKRNIARHEKRPIYVAHMDKRAIEETCNWVFAGHNEPEASIQACEAMMLNAYGRGSKYYNQLRDRVIAFWRRYHEVPHIPLWSEVDDRIYE